MVNDQNNRFYLKFEPALSTDVGTYKIVARNKIGQAIARAKIVVATIPLPPNPPEIMNVSDTEILLGWMQECDDPFAPILCFSLQYKLSGIFFLLITNCQSTSSHSALLIRYYNAIENFYFR